MKIQRAILLTLIIGIISGTGMITMEFLNGQKNTIQGFNKLNLKTQENYSFTHAKLVAAIKELSNLEVSSVANTNTNQSQDEVKKIGTQLDQFYIWLKNNQISLRSQINDVSQEWDSAQNRNDRNKIKTQLQGYSSGLIKRGVKNFEHREYIRNTIAKLTKSIDQLGDEARSSITVATNNSEVIIAVRELLEAFIINARDAKVEFGQSVMQMQNNIKANNKKIMATLTVLASLAVVLLTFFAFRRNTKKIETVEVEIPQKTTTNAVENIHDNITSIKEIFAQTSYPVILANSSYSIIWNNDRATNLKIDTTKLKSAVKVLQAGQDGLHTVELNKKYFHFSINQIHSYQSSINVELSSEMGDRKLFLIQLIPTEKPIFGHSTVIDKKSLQYIQSTYANSQTENYDINSLMASLLTKTNYIFQLSGTVIDFKSTSTEINCLIDRKLLENALKNVFIEIHGLIKDNPKLKKIGIEISSMDQRLNFSFYIPGLTLNSELWQRKNSKVENGIQSAMRFEEIEASMASYRCRLIMRAIEEASNPVTEITLSVENRDHLKQFKNTSASIERAN